MAYIDSGKVYKITNIETGKVLDISNDYKRSIVGNDFHESGTQLWILQRRGPMWAIQSIGSPYCLGLEREPEYHNPVVATLYHGDEYCWWIVPDDANYDQSVCRILANSNTDMTTSYNIELTWHGQDPNMAQMRPARLQRKYNRNCAQLWRFEIMGLL